MATVYKLDIELSSPWCSYNEETIKKTVKNALEGLLVDDGEETTNRLEDVIIKIEIIA